MADQRINPHPPSGPLSDLDRLIRLVATLRGKDGCPWDRQQTPRSILVYLTEELYELVDAIEAGQSERVCEELGDVLFHILFIARIYEEKGVFDIGRAAGLNADKMTRRHPHVFGDAEADTPEEVLKRWEAIKAKEKQQDQGAKGDQILVLRRDKPHANALHDPQKEPAQHRSGDAADAARNGGGKALEPGGKAHKVVNLRK